MELALGLILAAFMFGALLLMLAVGYQQIERERAASETEPMSERLLDRPRFFANLPSRTQLAEVPTVPPQLLEHLEERLRMDFQSASLFADEPTREGICPDYSAYVDAVGRELERHIQHERAAATAFVAEPAIERLWGDSGQSVSDLLRRHQVRYEATVSPHKPRTVS